ncbi:hypothetical protein ACHAW6_009587 [Cyclotella cf. meneghiniana]
MSTAQFDRIILAVDGMLVWTVQPTEADCEVMNVGEREFHCFSKDKLHELDARLCKTSRKGIRLLDICYISTVPEARATEQQHCEEGLHNYW